MPICRQKRKITKEMILSAALELLREGGIEAVNVKALARES
jgi:AcrR family transcriptional regulator